MRGTDLRTTLASSSLNDFQQKEILELDSDRNGRLEESDLVPHFGRQAADRYFVDLQNSVRKNDFNRFRGTLGKLEQAKAQFFAQSFQDQLIKNRPTLECDGVEFQGGKIRLTGVQPDKQAAVAQSLAKILKGPYDGEFKGMSAQESQDFLARVQDFVRRQGRGGSGLTFLRMDQIAQQLLVTEAQYWSRQGRSNLGQKEYAEEFFHEIHTPRHVASLEKKYHIDLRRTGGELTVEQAATLDRLLGTLKAKAPQDFARLSVITLHLGVERGGGLTRLEEGGRIDLYGPFAPPLAEAKLAASYSEDMIGHYKGDAETFLTEALAHEMGHVTETKLAMDFYRRIFPNDADRVLEERYAEDYRIFLLSGGTRVATKGSDHRSIGNDAKRLGFHCRMRSQSNP